jgi:LytTr DNA-binding domain
LPDCFHIGGLGLSRSASDPTTFVMTTLQLGKSNLKHSKPTVQVHLLTSPELDAFCVKTLEAITWAGQWSISEDKAIMTELPAHSLTLLQLDTNEGIAEHDTEQSVLICFSTHAIDALEAWRLGADAFILIDGLDLTFHFRAAVYKALELMFSVLPNNLFGQTIILPISDGKTWEVNPEEILYLQAKQEYCWCYTAAQGRKAIFIRLGKCQELLAAFGFVRVHKSYLVNTVHIAKRKSVIFMRNGDQIPIARLKQVVL